MQQTESGTPIVVQKEKESKVAAAAPIYDMGVQELHRVSVDEPTRRQVDHDFNEARGRDGARLHVTLKALTEADKRSTEAIEALAKRLEERVSALERRFDGLTSEIGETRTSLANQTEATLQSLTANAQESTDRLAVDVRKLRDEVVSLVDSRMNQADASFAALRGDVEVVKYLVMDLIKDRIGRTDPKSKSF